MRYTSVQASTSIKTHELPFFAHEQCKAGAAGITSLRGCIDSISAAIRPSRSKRRGQRFENYELLLDEKGRPIELGRGAMGITYKAYDVDLRFPVAPKVISEKYVGDESARLLFLREARAAAKLRHSNVASVLHLGRSGRDYFYAMEFVAMTIKHFKVPVGME